MQSHVPSDEACLPDMLSGTPEQCEFLDMILTPGRKFDLSRLSPRALAKLPAIRQAEEERAKADWPNLCKYIPKNRAVLASGKQPKVVFVGDSITENWAHADPSFFDTDHVCRGIGGQTTAQILLRIYPDVVALRPEVVHILAGTNDVAANHGPVSDDTIVDNIRAMIDVAEANGIRVILASLTPAAQFHWRPGHEPAIRTRELNNRLKALSTTRSVIWVNYHSALTDEGGGLQQKFGNDGVHPNRDGYAAMRSKAEEAVRLALS